MEQRLEQLKVWLNQSGITFQDIAPASADASFRRYFRITDNGKTFIVMDAPPEKEDCKPFVHIANLLLERGLNVPKIIEQDLEQGFLLLSDLGTTVFLSELNNDTVDEMYGAAMTSLLRLQNHKNPDLPAYDKALLRTEMALFPDWYLDKHLNITLTSEHKEILEQTFAILVKNALAQPQVCVHRDYHSRNLMVNKDNPQQPGVIDFQDAVIGAVTYDLVSLLKDCYIRWPREKVQAWVNIFYTEAKSLGIISSVSFAEFLRWFDLMGLQRHIKVAGIFSRLYHRDGKEGYLNDIPLTMEYIFEVLALYPEFKPFQKMLSEIL
ncbi:MAG: phosphotransferase [Gammaproteobacteria bacterium]|nr:phosphotransferase [Gammaproteobacteria bacterium]MCW8987327.1 phosphotransferase [Gammaproteobacteria bacterium]